MIMKIAKSPLRIWKQVSCHKHWSPADWLTDGLNLKGHKIDEGCYCNLLFISKLLDNYNFAQILA